MMTRRYVITRLTSILASLVAFAAVQVSAVAAWDPAKVEAREAAVGETIAEFSGEDSTLGRFFEEAHGYAVFPKVGEAAFVIGGAHGKGEVFEQGMSIGIAKISAVSVGLSFGGKTFQEIIFFKSKAALDKFTGGKFTFGAKTSIVFVKDGAGAKAVWSDDVAIFARGGTGAMVDASIAGQKFKFEAH